MGSFLNRKIMVPAIGLVFFLFPISDYSKNKLLLTAKSLSELDLSENLPDLSISFKMDYFLKKTVSPKKKKRLIRRNTFVEIKNTGKTVAKDFFVDLILSSDKTIPIQLAQYSSYFEEDIPIIGGRVKIESLAPGISKILTLAGEDKIPSDTPVGKYYLGAIVDADKKVQEKDESNNIAFRNINVLARIIRVSEIGVIPSNSGNIELNIHGKRFGNVAVDKIIRIGPYPIDYLRIEHWSNQHLIIPVPDDIPFGRYYWIYLMKDNVRISNKKKILLKVDIEGCFRLVNGERVSHGPVGSKLQILGWPLGAIQGNRAVVFGSQTARVLSWSNYLVEIIAPDLPTGDYEVYIDINGLDISLQHASFHLIAD